MAKRDYSDTIEIMLDGGRYRLEITRNRGRLVNESKANGIYSILDLLIKYHDEGLLSSNDAPFDKEDYEPRPVKWSLGECCELPQLQKKVLEGILKMHNQVINGTNKNSSRFYLNKK